MKNISARTILYLIWNGYSKNMAAKRLFDISELLNQHNAEPNRFNANGKLVDSDDKNDMGNPIHVTFMSLDTRMKV